MKKRDESWWHDLVIRWQSSGTTKADFAQQAGVSKATFYYWCRKLVGAPAAAVSGSSFSLLDSGEASEVHVAVRISYPSGVRIEFFSCPDAEVLKKLV